ncbi:hypothetical protein TWF281_006545 [Arthrobotrys megalospora]
MFLPEALLGLFIRLILVRGVEGEPRTIAPILNTSSIDTRPPITADSCCFVVQDRIDDYYWRRYTFTVTENIYAVTTHVSIYPTGKVTNVETNVYTRINPTYRPTPGPLSNALDQIKDPLRPPSGYRYNQAPGLKAVDSTELNSKDGTKIVTAGTTVFSPSAFNVYNSVKILKVPPVTDSNGNAVCVTASWNPDAPFASDQGGRTFTGMNSYVHAYYGKLGTCVPNIVTFTETIEDDANGTGPTTVLSTMSATLTLDCSYTPTGGTPPPVVTEIKFTEPYIRIPKASETVHYNHFECAINRDVPQEMWGYFPQDVIDFVISNPFYSSQYPDITRCFPGGPHILPQTIFHCEFPQLLDPQVTLTSYEDRTITIGSEFIPTTGGGGSRTRAPAQVDTTTTASPSDEYSSSPQPNPTQGQPTETDPPGRGTPSDSLPVDEPPNSQSSRSSPTSDSTPGSPQDPSSLSTVTTNPDETQSRSGSSSPTIGPEQPNNLGTTITVPHYFFPASTFVFCLTALLSI